MKRLFLAMAALVAGCVDTPDAASLRPVDVDYSQYLNVVARSLGFNITETTYETLDVNLPGAAPATYYMAILPKGRYNADQLAENGYRPAKTHDLFFYAAQYPEAMPKNQAVCAPDERSRLEIPGSTVIGMPAVNRDKGVGVLAHCRWFLIVLKEPLARPAA